MNLIIAQLKIRKQQTNKKNRFLGNIGTGFSIFLSSVQLGRTFRTCTIYFESMGIDFESCNVGSKVFNFLQARMMKIDDPAADVTNDMVMVMRYKIETTR